MSCNHEEVLKNLYKKRFGQEASHVNKLEGHASKRQIFRLSSKNSSCIGVFNPDPLENKAFIGFSKHFKNYNLPVPEILAEDISNLAYLEQDLGDLTLLGLIQQQQNGISEAALQIYRNVLSLLPKFQISAARDLDYSLCYQGQIFNAEAMHADLISFADTFLVQKLPEYDSAKLKLEFKNFCAKLDQAQYQTFMYRDLQARNIMVYEGRPYFIDYQSGRKGPLQYDLASLLYQSRAGLSTVQRAELTEYYLNEACKLTEIDRISFKDSMPAFVTLRLLQALSAYARAGLLEGKSYFAQSIPYALAGLRETLKHKQLGKLLPRLIETLELL